MTSSSQVRILNEWITMPGGVQLSARVWIPGRAPEAPVPAILEYIPYRKDDLVASRDAPIATYHATHGYAYVRVDIRGTGSSGGIITDEYTERELDDGLEVIEWIASQPWCSGSVGMIGISWGGFNGLQLAARRPTAMGAVISLCSTDDRYADDVHYIGGCVLAIDMLPWAAHMLPIDVLPPAPSVVGESWREQWFERLVKTPPMIDAWLAHQRRDAYWKHGSVCEDFGAIECPVYMVGGWGDGYTNAIPRTVAGLAGARRGLIGPWGHAWPQSAAPGPRIGFLQEAIRWWDRWLGGIANGIDEEPMLHAWIQEWVPPGPDYEERPGRWVACDAWPPIELEAQPLYLGVECLEGSPGEAHLLEHHSSQHHGLLAGAWCPGGDGGRFPGDQREEDALCLTFDTPVLDEDVELLGSPILHLRVAIDQLMGLVVARLCDVSPDGSSLLLSRGVLNLTHRDGHEDPKELSPGQFYDISVELSALGARIPAGHHIRLALSSTYWPWIWPSPYPVVIKIETGRHSWVDLPVRPPGIGDGPAPEFGEPATGEQLATTTSDGEGARQVRHDPVTGAFVLVDRDGESSEHLDAAGITITYTDYVDRFTITSGAPLSARVECQRAVALRGRGWDVKVVTRSSMSASETAFLLRDEVEAFDGGEEVFTRIWERNVPRDFV